ncbi:MAG: hypothetical protein IJR95_00255 [Lachnospiraceae bacterium]|nr:hypothetical protein [Lachnospiraceae bacterium]
MAGQREIGSEFWDVPVCEGGGAPFPADTQWYLAGRSALQAILRELKDCRTVAIPSWCCDSIIAPFAEAGLAVRFYSVFQQGRWAPQPRTDCDILFLMDFFGYTGPVSVAKDYTGIVIRDVTHSLFSATYEDADYYFGSLRKWCGIWTGGYAWRATGGKLPEAASQNPGYVHLRKTAMRQKEAYIRGNSSDKGYLQLFGRAEEMLESAGLAGATDRDIRLAKKLDLESIKARRRANAGILRQAFPEWLIFSEMQPEDCPMFVPIWVPEGKRDALRQALIRQEIYCPVHWPLSPYHILKDSDRAVYQHELSLVCDQRYGEADMLRMADAIRACWTKLP